jgi:hypothetical protein
MLKDTAIPSRQARPARIPFPTLFLALTVYAKKDEKRGKKHGEREENMPKMKRIGKDDVNGFSLSIYSQLE